MGLHSLTEKQTEQPEKEEGKYLNGEELPKCLKTWTVSMNQVPSDVFTKHRFGKPDGKITQTLPLLVLFWWFKTLPIRIAQTNATIKEICQRKGIISRA